MTLLAMPARGETWPQVEVANIRRVFHNGEHNAFTDLVRFRDKFYLAFRSCPDGHMVHPSSSILIRRGDACVALLPGKPYARNRAFSEIRPHRYKESPPT